MTQKSIVDIAESFGLTVESVLIPDHETAYRVYKGAKQIFIGTDEAVRSFLASYKDELPTPSTGAIRGYKE